MDAFLLARLEKEGLGYSPEAPKEKLLRRLAEKEQQQVGTRQKGFWDKVREIFE